MPAACPNCGRRTQRTKDWVCEWCGYPLLYGNYKQIDKTYKELQEERNSSARAYQSEEEPDDDYREAEEAPEPEPPPPPKQPLWKIKKAPRPTYPTRREPEPEYTPEPESRPAPAPRPRYQPTPPPRTNPETVPPLQPMPPIQPRYQPAPPPTPPAHPRYEPAPAPASQSAPEPLLQPLPELPLLPRMEPQAQPLQQQPMVTPPPPQPARAQPGMEPAARSRVEVPPLRMEPPPRVEPPPPPPPPREEPLYLPALDSIKNGTQLSIDQLDALFRADNVGINEALKEKTVVIKGIVNKVFIRDHLDIRYMILTGARRVVWSARCQFEKEAAGPIGRLTEGQAVALKGKYDGYGKNIIFKNCELVAGGS